MKTAIKIGRMSIFTFSLLVISFFNLVSFSRASTVEIWAKDPSGSYPMVLATKEWVLIGTTLGENFEEGYTGQQSLEDFLVDSILRISGSIKPKVGVFSGGDGGDVAGMQHVMDKYLNRGDIDSFDLVVVNPTSPMNVALSTLLQYDVVVLDPATCKGSSYKFLVTGDTKLALSQYLKSGGKIVASAYLFVYWNDYLNWGREFYNEDLSFLFGGAKPDITTYYPSAISCSPFSQGEPIQTDNVVVASQGDPWFHYFWKLEIPVIEVEIAIKPGGGLNSINPKSNGKVPVAILSTKDFNALSQIDPNSITFGHTGDEQSLAFCHGAEDVNGDGLLDLVCHFYIQDTGFQCADTKGILKGATKSGKPLGGSDSVNIVQCK